MPAARSAAARNYLVALFWQELVAACHWPPAFSQSALLLSWDRSLDVPPVEGLADGEVEGEADPFDFPELGVSALLGPLGLLMPEPAGGLEDPPLELWAATSAGVKAMARASTVNRTFFIVSLLTVFSDSREACNPWTRDLVSVVPR